jgi:fucose permease
MGSRNRLFFVLVFGFVLLGMPAGAVGVMWPSAADDLGRSLAELGFVTLAYGGGYTIATLLSGGLTRRLTTGPMLISAALLAAGSLVVLTTTWNWLPFLAATLALGGAGGLLDAGTNSYVAIHRGVRAMGILHAGYGVGSTLGPLLVTAVLAVGWSWRVAFGILAVADVLLAVVLLVSLREFEPVTVASARHGAPGKARLVGLSVVTFFLYAGVSAGTGVWAFSLLTEGRGFSDGTAGLAVTAYWGGLTVSRVLLGVVGNRIDPNRVLTISAAATLGALILFWLEPTPWLGIGGLIVVGFAHGPIFPLEILLTADRFGAGYTPWVVGYEVAAANVGLAVVPTIIAAAVGVIGLEAVAPALTLCGVGLVIVVEALGRESARVVAAI